MNFNETDEARIEKLLAQNNLKVTFERINWTLGYRLCDVNGACTQPVPLFRSGIFPPVVKRKSDYRNSISRLALTAPLGMFQDCLAGIPEVSPVPILDAGADTVTSHLRQS